MSQRQFRAFVITILVSLTLISMIAVLMSLAIRAQLTPLQDMQYQRQYLFEQQVRAFETERKKTMVHEHFKEDFEEDNCTSTSVWSATPQIRIDEADYRISPNGDVTRLSKTSLESLSLEDLMEITISDDEIYEGVSEFGRGLHCVDAIERFREIAIQNKRDSASQRLSVDSSLSVE